MTEKQLSYHKQWRANNLDKSRAAWRKYYAANKEKIYKQKLESVARWQKENPGRVKEIRRKYNQKYYYQNQERNRIKRNQPEEKAKLKEWKAERLSVPSKRLQYALKAARARAKKKNITFEKELYQLCSNPPTKCDCCGLDLDYSTRNRSNYDRSPSFDRLDNSIGYTVTNIKIICYRCNAKKSDATLEELKAIVAYIEREQKK